MTRPEYTFWFGYASNEQMELRWKMLLFECGRLWLLSKEIQDGTLLQNVYNSFTLPTELDRNYEKGVGLV